MRWSRLLLLFLCRALVSGRYHPTTLLEPFSFQGKAGLRHFMLKLQQVLLSLGFRLYYHPVSLALDKLGGKPHPAQGRSNVSPRGEWCREG